MEKREDFTDNKMSTSGAKSSDCWLWKSVNGKDGMVPLKPDLRFIVKFFKEKFETRRIGRSLYIFNKDELHPEFGYWSCISTADLDAWLTEVLAGTDDYYADSFKSNTIVDARKYLINKFTPPAKGEDCNDLGVVDGYIPCKNGVLGLKSGELQPKGPHFGFEGGLDIDYMSAEWGQDICNSPNFDKFMDEICIDAGEIDRDKRKMMLELMGLCISGVPNSKAQHIFILTGGGGNGKSVFCSLLRMLTGKRNSNLSTDELRANSSHSLAGSFVNIMEEQISNLGRRDWSLLKSLSSGDAITVKQKYVDDKVIMPTAKLVMTCNKLPSLQEDTEAIKRRLCVFKLKNSFRGREDKFLLSKIKPELTGVLYKAVEAYKDFVKRGYKFEEVQSVINASSEHQATGRETYKMFVDDCLELSANRNVYVKKDYLHGAYNAWCDLVFGKSHYGRERLRDQASNIKEYLGELARADELMSNVDVTGINISREGEGPFKRRMISGEKVRGLYCVRLSKDGLNHLRNYFKASGQPLPPDVPYMSEDDAQAQLKATQANIIRGRFNEQD